MRFPKIHQVFDRIRSTHHKYDLNNDGHLQLKELSEAMNELMNGAQDGADTVDFSHIENVFMLSDLDHHGLEEGLDVKEVREVKCSLFCSSAPSYAISSMV